MHITLHTNFLYTHLYISITEKIYLVFLFYISKNDKLKTHIRLNLNSIYMGNILFVWISFIELTSIHVLSTKSSIIQTEENTQV